MATTAILKLLRSSSITPMATTAILNPSTSESPSAPPEQREQVEDENGNSGVAIGVPTGIAVVTLAAIVVAVFIYKRKQSREEKESTPSTTAPSVDGQEPETQRRHAELGGYVNINNARRDTNVSTWNVSEVDYVNTGHVDGDYDYVHPDKYIHRDEAGGDGPTNTTCASEGHPGRGDVVDTGDGYVNTGGDGHVKTRDNSYVNTRGESYVNTRGESDVNTDVTDIAYVDMSGTDTHDATSSIIYENVGVSQFHELSNPVEPFHQNDTQPHYELMTPPTSPYQNVGPNEPSVNDCDVLPRNEEYEVFNFL
ncbi:hypothetical protein NP493_120g00002 [Ridgeia piscesae]|uniref:Uncharacterized protein n=1 Tax=Ridgeia piscesae TaxID=27915 RepID=A0AAD9UH21_RIDPI|nr:hypothetical protein NP493_120g00002 [Ridgeia piscesae]